MGIFGKIFKSANERNIIKLSKIADRIEALSDEYAAMSEEELRGSTEAFRKRLAEGETLDDILVEAYATVREASSRVLNMRHFHVQLIGGIALHQGRIAEMSTGEGKTLVATLPAYLNALTGKGMHVVTVNEYLAKRDAEWMGKIYKYLGLTVGVVVPGMAREEKKAAYDCDIIYATNNELGFDYLRDNMVAKKEHKLQRELNFAIVDEVDSILIDEARTPLIISGGNGKTSELYITANRFAKTLKEEDYIIEEKEKTVRLSDDAVEKAEKYFRIDNLSDIDNQEIVHHINNALKAHYIMQKDKDYVVNEGEVVIVDEFTGRLMVGRRYSDGLHQAIEAKENVRIQGESKTLATITFQNFFRLYGKLSGMTGTAKTEEAEFNSIYKLDVVVIPTNKPKARVDENDKLYSSVAGKMRAIVADVTAAHSKGQPVLIGTATVEKSEEVSKLLTKAKIPHNVLNAKNHAREAEIIAQAGKVGAVTIATNMAGRGTDIMLGGNPEYMSKEKLANLGYSHEAIVETTSFAPVDNEEFIKAREDYKKYYALFEKDIAAEREKVRELGGLRIIGTSRHDSRRIDDQLRGRAGRQGDPGSSVFYLSMEDDLLRIFGGETMKNVADRFNFDEDYPIEAKVITSQIERAQQRIENRDFSIRKQVLAYDDIMNYQRKMIYAERNKVLDGLDITDQIEKMIIDVAEDIISNYADSYTLCNDWDFEGFNGALEQRFLPNGENFVTYEKCQGKNYNQVRDMILDHILLTFRDKAERLKATGLDFEELERAVLLRMVDTKWMTHMTDMQTLKQGIGLLAYGQRDPIVAYRNEGTDMFNEMTEAISRDTVTILCKSEFEHNVERKQVGTETSNNGSKTVVREGKKVGRNDPCPCGSGKKYKNCCGA